MNRLNSLLIALVLSASAPAMAQTVVTPVPAQSGFAQADIDAVRLLLSGYHALGPKASFEAIPNGPSIVNDFARGKHSVVRDRALAALGQYWPSADVFLLYGNVIGSADTRVGTLHRVVRMSVETFGDRALPMLKPLLSSDDLQLRLTVIVALGSLDNDEARAAILAVSDTSNPPFLEEAIDKATQYAR